MKKSYSWLHCLCLVLVCGGLCAAPLRAQSPIPVRFQIDTRRERAPISPYIYGTNQDFVGDEGWTARRLGGNRTTGFNWETNASNAGEDWHHVNDDWLCGATGASTEDCQQPGGLVRNFHQDTLDMGAAYSLITLQLAGYVSNDVLNEVSEAETAPSPRWVPVYPAKGAPFAFPPDLTDGAVYLDEKVAYLVDTFGGADTPTGVRGYALDNEPALWSGTHPRIHPEKVTYTELISRSVAAAQAVKAVDPAAELFGPALYGFGAFYNLQSAPDTSLMIRKYEWFVEYYLDQMRLASEAAGVRLLDVLDLHWYPEARGGGMRIVFNEGGTVETQKARLQAPRILWDPTAREDSWIYANWRQFMPLIPRLQRSIDAYYPGTKLAFTEFSYGGGGDVSGGIAHADVLGVFGTYNVYLATLWQMGEETDYYSAAYRLYRNYDGQRATYGDTRVFAETDNWQDSSVYASIVGENDAELHLIVLNKNVEQPLQADFDIQSDAAYTYGRVWGFDQSGPDIREAAAITAIADGRFTYTVPPLTAYHIVLHTGAVPAGLPRAIATPLPSPTAVPTATSTATPSPTAPPEPVASATPMAVAPVVPALPVAWSVIVGVGLLGGAVVLWLWRKRRRRQ